MNLFSCVREGQEKCSISFRCKLLTESYRGNERLDDNWNSYSAAETGHLVLGTLHTLDAPETINRIVDVFPPEQQSQIILQLSQVLVAVLSQSLVPLIGGGRVPACEIMISNIAIKNTIRQKQIHMLHGIMELGQNEGMQTLNQALSKLVKEGRVTESEAMAKSSDIEQFEAQFKNGRQMAHQRR